MTTVFLAPTAGAFYQAFTAGGLPLNAGLLYTYSAGTTTPLASYTDYTGATPNANPIVLGADGRPPNEIWLDVASSYRIDVKDSAGNLIATYDNLYNAAIASVSSSIQSQSATAFTTTGTSTAYVLTPSPALTSLSANERFCITFHTASGATPTLAVSGLTAKSVTYRDSSGTKQAVTSTQIPTGWETDTIYDGTDWVIQIPSGTLTGLIGPTSGGTGIANNAASTLTISGAYATTVTITGATGITLPTSGTLAISSASQTFTGTQTVIASATQDAVALSGRAGGTSSYVATITPATLSASRTVTIPDAATTIPIATQTLTFSGPTAARTITLPDANFTVARTDAANTFTGVQTMTSPNFTTPVLGTPTSGALTNCTADGTDQVGFKNIPVNSQSAAYGLVLADGGKAILHPSTDANARTFTIPANGSVAYPIGTAITFINLTSQVVSIAITTDTMYLSSAGTTGSRSLAQYGVATAIKYDSTHWIINGSGLT